MGKSRQKPIKPKHKRHKTWSKAQLIGTPKSPNREIVHGYAERANYVDMEKLLRLGFDPYKTKPNDPRVEVFDKLRELLGELGMTIHMNVVVVDMPGVKSIWKLFNSSKTKVFFLKHDYRKGVIMKSVIYPDDGIARAKFAAGKVLYTQFCTRPMT